MKNVLLIILSSSLHFSTVVRADESRWPSVTISSYVTDKYLGFGTGNLLSKNPAIQTDLFISFKNGLYLDFWNSKSLKGSWDDGSFGNEVDYKIGWKGNLAKDLTLNIGVTYFDEPSAFTLGAGDIIYTHAYLTKGFKHLSLTAGYENYTTMPGSGFQGGNLISLGISRNHLFYKDRFSLSASAVLVYDTGTLGSSDGFIARGNVGASWNITQRFTFNVIGMNWFVPITPNDKRVTDAMVYSGFTFRFN